MGEWPSGGAKGKHLYVGFCIEWTGRSFRGAFEHLSI